MRKFIFGERSGVYIIDLQQTAQRLKAAAEFLKGLVSSGHYVLFVGTKKQAQDIIVSEAGRCGMFYVNERWLGGTLTNFETIRKSIERLKELRALTAPESSISLSKKEKADIDKESAKLSKKLAGIVEMKKLPAALVLVDPKNEETAVREAARLEIPIVALLDTNCDPDKIAYPVPGNDDAIKSIKLVITLLADNILEARKKLDIKKSKQQEEAEQKKADQETSTEGEEELIEDVEKKVEQPADQRIQRKPETEGGEVK
jgi:small subunit ribosomal protein S2